MYQNMDASEQPLLLRIFVQSVQNTFPQQTRARGSEGWRSGFSMVEPWTKKGQTSTRQRRQPAAPRGLGRWQCGEWFWRRHLKPLLTRTDEPLDDACDIAHGRMSRCHPLPRARLTAAVSCASPGSIRSFSPPVSLRLGRGLVRC